jgi:hypothetical protein
MHPPNPMTITKNEPTSLIQDFQSFLDYVETNKPGLTPKGFVSGKDLFEMNQQMTHPHIGTTVRTGQEYYPQLHLFFHLAQAGRLIQKAQGKGAKIILQTSDRAGKYAGLTTTEKYFFLLETFWVDTRWEFIEASVFKGLGIMKVQTVLEHLTQKKSEVPIRATALLENPAILGYFWIYFALLGFWTVTQKNEINPAYKRFFNPDMVTPHPLGIILAALLIKERDFLLWNLSFRRRLGKGKILFSQSLPEGYPTFQGPAKSRKLKVVQKDKSGEPFFLPFVPLFAEGELLNTLPRETEKSVKGVYLFRVSLSSRLWRKIEMSSNHTLLDLHNAIQNAFQFDDDHLYSFFMDGIPWSEEKFTSLFDDEGPHVDQVTIGELGLGQGQTFLYLFDYGDEWRFQVTLETIRQDNPHPKKPRIVEAKGDSPEQYL